MRNPSCADIDVIEMTAATESQTSDCTTGAKPEQSISKKYNLQKRTFGSSLKDLVERNETNVAVVPYVLHRLCTYIEMNGIKEKELFGSRSNPEQLAYLKSCFNQVGDAPLETDGSVFLTADLLKLFLLELTDPVIPSSMHAAFSSALNGQNKEDCVRNLKKVLKTIPEKNFLVVKYISHFLHKVVSHEKENEISASTLGNIFGSLLFSGSTEDGNNFLKPFGYKENFKRRKIRSTRIEKADTWQKMLMNEIVVFFITDYYTIFGTEILNVPEIKPFITQEMNFISIASKNIGKKKISPVPSSVMPLLPLEPLSVVIPPFDDQLLSLTSMQSREIVDQQVPVLIINNTLKNFDQINQEKITDGRNDSILGRKRKERRPSGEDPQPPRSSSEERPPFKRDEELFFPNKDQIRRFNSHEEVRAVVESTDNENKLQQKAEVMNNNQTNNGSNGEKCNLASVKESSSHDFRDYSPHPPKPKRREIDSSEYFKNQQEVSLMDVSEDSAEFRSVPYTGTTNITEYTTNGNVTAIKHKTKESEEDQRYWMSESSGLSLSPKNEEETESFKENISELRPVKSIKTKEDKIYNGHCVTTWDKTLNFHMNETNADVPAHKTNKQQLERNGDNSTQESEIQFDSAVHEKYLNSSDKSEGLPPLDFGSLHEHADGNEPILSEHRFSWPLLKAAQDDDAVLSPSVNFLRKASSYEAPLSPSAYKSYLSHRSLHLDPNIPPSPPVEQDDFCKSLRDEDSSNISVKQLNKKIHSLKKKLKQFDETFEEEHGYRPSHAEKMNYPEVKKWISHLNKARKDLKALKEESHSIESAVLPVRPRWLPTRDIHILEDTTNSGGIVNERCEFCSENGIEGKFKPSVVESLDVALKDLCVKRKCAHRPEIVEDMTNEQIMDEKVAIQKALLQLESIHGRPTNKSDRDIMRPLYDRYRNVKRIIGKSNISTSMVAKNKDSGTELQPILEHVAMDFTSPQNVPRDGFSVCQEEVDKPLPQSSSEESSEEKTTSEWTNVLSTKYNSSNLHELPFSELLYQQQQTRSEKRRLRRVLKEFEDEFQRQNGRKVQKEEKIPMEAVYGEYKHIKGRLRLLEALVSKHEQCK